MLGLLGHKHVYVLRYGNADTSPTVDFCQEHVGRAEQRHVQGTDSD